MEHQMQAVIGSYQKCLSLHILAACFQSAYRWFVCLFSSRRSFPFPSSSRPSGMARSSSPQTPRSLDRRKCTTTNTHTPQSYQQQPYLFFSFFVNRKSVSNLRSHPLTFPLTEIRTFPVILPLCVSANQHQSCSFHQPMRGLLVSLFFFLVFWSVPPAKRREQLVVLIGCSTEF